MHRNELNLHCRTAWPARQSGSRAVRRCTYCRDPPRTVYHCGRSATCSRPWLWQKRIMVATGKRIICSVGQDQMQPIIGRK